MKEKSVYACVNFWEKSRFIYYITFSICSWFFTKITSTSVLFSFQKTLLVVICLSPFLRSALMISLQPFKMCSHKLWVFVIIIEHTWQPSSLLFLAYFKITDQFGKSKCTKKENNKPHIHSIVFQMLKFIKKCMNINLLKKFISKSHYSLFSLHFLVGLTLCTFWFLKDI